MHNRHRAVDGITEQTMEAIQKTVKGLAGERRFTIWPEVA
jgi:hypothetical protein